MKIRRSILWLCAVAVGLLVLVVWFGRRPVGESPASSQSPDEATVETAERKPAVAPGGREAVPSAPRPNVASPAATTGTPSSVFVQSKEEQAKEALVTLNDVPIDFYGRVQDQFGNPVSGAEITGSIIYDNGSSNGVREIKTVADANGSFEFHGGNGESLSVIPRKEGYALGSAEAGFKFSHFYPEARHVPNPSQPAVIEMRKLQGAERLIHFQSKAYVPLDGTPARFDLQTGRRVETGGDIIIRIESSPAPNVTEKYDWKATVQPVNGGLITSGTEFEKMYDAPESGYEPQFVVSFQKNAQPWSNGFNGGFYLRSRGGSGYGKLGLGINTDIVKNGAVLVMLNAYVNPAGSRNLELDPALVSEARP
jgi:hypothetical protein